MKRKFSIPMFAAVRGICTGGLLAVSAIAKSVLAHSDLDSATANPWAAWQFTPDIVFGTLLMAALYGAGLWLSRYKQQAIRPWQGVCLYP